MTVISPWYTVIFASIKYFPLPYINNSHWIPFCLVIAFSSTPFFWLTFIVNTLLHHLHSIFFMYFNFKYGSCITSEFYLGNIIRSPGRAWQPTPVFLPVESPGTEELGGLQSMGLQRVKHDRATKHSTRISIF